MVKALKDDSGTDLDYELTNLWIWVDANSNALVDLGEIKQAVSYVKALNVRPISYPSGDVEAPKGAVLQSGTMVPTWDWWSASAPVDSLAFKGKDKIFKVYYDPKVIGAVTVPAPATAKVYIWGMGDEMQGLLRFVSVGADDYVVSLPFGRQPVAGFYPATFSKINHAPGKLNWRFEGAYGDTTELAFVTGTPSQLIGVNGRESVGEDREAYSWKAEVLSGDSDEFVGAYIRAIAGFTEEDFTSAIGTVAEDVGTVRLLAGVDTAKTKFIPFLF